VHRLEFIVEPFVEGRPGAHVTEAVAALAAMGVEVDFGALSSSCVVAAERMPEVVATLMRVAFANGATRVNIDAGPIDGSRW
jgi:ribose/xylose/arabinose/galactoside ABC-type transport system permease subunit